MIFKKEFPILEYDPAQRAVINASEIHTPIDIPENAVACFFYDVFQKLLDDGKLTIAKTLKSEMGLHHIYKMEFRGKQLTVFHPGVGAPLAAGILEEVAALGAKKFIACGGAGVLDKEIVLGHLVIPKTAVRDEGTSYHYLQASREVEASAEGMAAIEKVLKRHNCDYVIGKTWTTDAFYRETEEKVRLRHDEGCIVVEMECAAFFAVAKFRKLIFAQLLYGGDDVSSSKWDTRDWDKQTSLREKIFWLAVEACCEL